MSLKILETILGFLKKIKVLKDTKYCQEKDRCELPKEDDEFNHVLRERDMLRVNYDEFKIPEIPANVDKPRVIVVDDLTTVRTIFNLDLDKIKTVYGKDVKEDFNLCYFIGPKAGFEAFKFVAVENQKVDYAFLDLTLGYLVKVDDDSYIEIDGIDLAITILKRNPNAKIIFSTASTLDYGNRNMQYFIDKFYEFSKIKLNSESEMYMNKNSDRIKTILNLLYGVNR